MTGESQPGWILIVGYGSIGRRHFQNLKTLGFDDVRLVRSKSSRPGAFDTPANTTVYDSLATALAGRPWMVVVATPTSMHLENCRESLAAGAWIFLEKPVAGSLEQSLELKSLDDTAGGRISMAYCFRHHPLYAQVTDWCRSNRIGRVFHVRTWQAGYLPAWHPWEDYRTGYAARQDLGGGVVRTLDHDLDWLAWTFGRPENVQAACGQLSDLELAVEDTAEMLIKFENNCLASAHVSFARQHASRGVSVSGTEGTIELNWLDNYAELTPVDGEPERLSLPTDFDLNSIYVDTLQSAINGFRAGQSVIPLSSGVIASSLSGAALDSSKSGRRISVAAQNNGT